MQCKSVHTIGMTKTQNAAFRHLVQRWLAHEDLRKSGAPVSKLAESRQVLDHTRYYARNTFGA